MTTPNTVESAARAAGHGARGRAAGPAGSEAVEDYAKAIYALSRREEGPVATNALAERLGVSPGTVTAMLKRMAGMGLVTHEPYRGVTLTESGRMAAIRVVRRHRLIEAYLVANLGYTWDSVHGEAERLEHAVSDELVERLAAALGYPEVDPHGDPIPDADGAIAHPALTSLAELSVGTIAEVRRVDTSDAERLRYLASAGLVPGTRLRVLEREPFKGPLTLEVAGRTQALGADLAAVVLCSVTPSTGAP